VGYKVLCMYTRRRYFFFFHNRCCVPRMQWRCSFVFTKVVTLFWEQILTDEIYWYKHEFAYRNVSYVTSTMQRASYVANSALTPHRIVRDCGKVASCSAGRHHFLSQPEETPPIPTTKCWPSWQFLAPGDCDVMRQTICLADLYSQCSFVFLVFKV
jgi:hypothetical protein